MSSLPSQPKTTDGKVNQFFDQYFNKKLSYPSNEVDAVIAFFDKRGFDKNAAISTAGVLLQQAKIDGVKVFELLDTLQGLESVQLSAVVTEILNYNRLATSTLGYKVKNTANKTEKRNIIL